MTHENVSNTEQLRARLEARVAERQGWLQEAAELFGGEGAIIEKVFQLPMTNPGEARRDSPSIAPSPEDEAKMREIAGRFGIGGEQDVTLEDAGLLPGHVRINEGGLAWKMLAEHKLESAAGTYIYAGSPYQATTATEQAHEVKMLDRLADTVSNTQYEAAEIIARSHPDFVPLERPYVMPFGYDIQNNHALVVEPTGQLVQIGTRNGKPVMMLRVDRENYVDGNGDSKYRNQPDTASQMTFVSDVLTACGDEEKDLGVVTSNTYASRAIDVERAGLRSGRQFGVAMYGRATLAEAKGEPVATPTELVQFMGEFAVLNDKNNMLKNELQTA